jgi:hypothetical protein
MGSAASTPDVGARRTSKRLHTRAHPFSSIKREKRELPSALPDDILLTVASNFVARREMDWRSLLSVRAVCVSWRRLMASDNASQVIWPSIIHPPHATALAVGLRGAGPKGPRVVDLDRCHFALQDEFELLRGCRQLRYLRLPTPYGLVYLSKLEESSVLGVLESIQSRAAHIIVSPGIKGLYAPHTSSWSKVADDWNIGAMTCPAAPCATCDDVQPVGFDCDVCAAPRCCQATMKCDDCDGWFCSTCDNRSAPGLGGGVLECAMCAVQRCKGCASTGLRPCSDCGEMGCSRCVPKLGCCGDACCSSCRVIVGCDACGEVFCDQCGECQNCDGEFEGGTD